ncbi:hypothetical protein [Chryseolinea sp. H1M3-3]|uniref:hypothetical protein n=1 Tax=Chryseolinea sp. H1M3-3 TaxID=3034144 RepID=UPI0023EC37EA|nr:hypothetical protein [Chryseolinea sp. H1M3-3]
MKKGLIWTVIVAVVLLLIWNLGSEHVDGVKSEKDWYISQLKFDFSGVLDSAEKKGQALIRVTRGHIEFDKEARLKDKLRFNGLLDLFLYRQDGKIDLMISGQVQLQPGDSVYVNTELKTAKFFRDGEMMYEQPLLKSLRGRPF